MYFGLNALIFVSVQLFYSEYKNTTNFIKIDMERY